MKIVVLEELQCSCSLVILKSLVSRKLQNDVFDILHNPLRELTPFFWNHSRFIRLQIVAHSIERSLGFLLIMWTGRSQHVVEIAASILKRQTIFLNEIKLERDVHVHIVHKGLQLLLLGQRNKGYFLFVSIQQLILVVQMLKSDVVLEESMKHVAS